MMALGIVGSLVGGVVSAMGAMQAAQAQQAAAMQNAEIAKYNKAVADRNKTAALAEADSAANDQQNKNNRQMATIRAAYGASGITLEGSPLAVMQDTAIEDAFDVEKINYKGKVTATGYDDQGKNYAMQEHLYQMEASSAAKAGSISAVGALIGGVTGAAKFGISNAGSSLMG